MAHAEKQAYIHTPYAVFSKDMYEGMKEITDSVPEVTMLLNATSVGDNFMASSDYTRNRGKYWIQEFHSVNTSEITLPTGNRSWWTTASLS